MSDVNQGYGGAKQSRSIDLSDILTEKVTAKAKTSRREETRAQADIETNPFYQVVFDEALSLDEKKSEFRKLQSAEGTREEVKARIKALNEFKEYLQEQRELMSREIIELTDTETFSELKKTYEDINTALLEFEDQMRPLTDIIDALFKLRQDGTTLDAFKEIKSEDARRAEIAAKEAELAAQLDAQKKSIDSINQRIALARTKKGLFGFGGLTESARQEIAAGEVALASAQAAFEASAKAVEDLKTQASSPGSDSNIDQAAKEQLRKLLDISSDEHIARQTALVNSALTFLETSKERIGSIRNHLGHMDEQVENLNETNNQMTRIYALLSESTKEAEGDNKTLRDSLSAVKDGETKIEQLDRESKQREVDEFIKVLESTAVDTEMTYADLTSQALRIKTMKEANMSQVNKARDMHTRGVASVADRLSTVLQAVSGAAVNESSAMAADTLNTMMASTNSIAQKEAIRVALGAQEQNSELERAIADLAAYGEVTKAATNITREAVAEMRDQLDRMKDIANSVQEDLSESLAVNAEAIGGGSSTRSGTVKSQGSGGSRMPKMGKVA